MSLRDRYIDFLAAAVDSIVVSLTEHRVPTCTEESQLELLQQARQWHILTPTKAQRLPFPQRLLPLLPLEAQEQSRLECLALPQEGWRNQDEAQRRRDSGRLRTRAPCATDSLTISVRSSITHGLAPRSA